MKNIYGVTNNFNTKEERLTVLTTYRNKLLKLLKEGFNPFEDNSELLEKRKGKEAAKALNNGFTAAGSQTISTANYAVISNGTDLPACIFLANYFGRSHKKNILKDYLYNKNSG